jgi:hypothetical protein
MADSKNPERIAELHQSEIAVPWCDEFEKMISGMKSVYTPILQGKV